VVNIVQGLDNGWKTPWKTLIEAISDKYQPEGAKHTHGRKITALALQAKQALRATERVNGLPAPAADEASLILTQLQDIADNLGECTLPPAAAADQLSLLAGQADSHHAQCYKW